MRLAIKRAETENLFEILANKSPVGLCIVRDGRFCYTNPAFQSITGYGEDELLGRDPLELIVPEDKEMVRENTIKVLKGERILPYQFRMTHKDGSTKWIMESIVTIRYRGRWATLGNLIDITERKQEEEVLHAERSKLQSLIDATTDAFNVIDRDYNVIYQNKLAKRLFGDRMGEKCYLAFEGNKNVCDGCPVKEAFESGEPHTTERRTVTPAGAVVFRENTANPIRDTEGRIVSCLEVARDVTKHKQMEETLRNSEEKLRQIFESAATDGISVTDLKGIIIDANQRMVEMHGFRSKNELLWNNIFELLAPRERNRIAANLREAMEEGAISGIECTLLRADGSAFPGELSINTLRDVQGNPFGHITIARDITKRKETDEALKYAAEEWSRTFDSINDAVCTNSKDFRLLRVNKAFADMYHVEPSQVIGKRCYEVTGESKGPIEGCPHQETLRTEKPAKSEFFLHEKGTYVEISTSPIFSKKGEIVGSVHITRDITEQKKQNERLMSTDRLASLGELAAGTAHEFNNPLTSVIGLSELLMQRELPDDIREDLKIINNEAQRAANVARNLLAFGGKHAPEKQPNQINSIIEDVLELRAYEHRVKNIDVEKHLALNLPKIMADYFQMQQVFMNIIINAEYFMTEAHGRGTLTITTEKQNDTVKISIADDGPGIPQENLKRIFDPFFTTKGTGKGTGLGLSICHSIVSEHGGQIYVSSQLGKGTTSFVELPIDSHDRSGGRHETG
jgi:PAS domain S-box-containing protein